MNEIQHRFSSARPARFDETKISGVQGRIKLSHTFAAQIIRAAFAEADRNTERAVEEVVNSVFKIPKVIPLKTLLDAHSRGNNLSAGNEPDMVDRELKEKQRKTRVLRR